MKITAITWVDVLWGGVLWIDVKKDLRLLPQADSDDEDPVKKDLRPDSDDEDPFGFGFGLNGA